MLTPEAVITSLRQADEYIRPIFMNGGCWRFHKFLKTIFPEAEPYKVAVSAPGYYDHIITKIGDALYDITGTVSEKDFASFAPVQEADVQQFEKWSFAHNNLLFKRCPACGEEILFNQCGKIVPQF